MTYYKALVSYANTFLSNLSTSEDVVQDVFSKLFESDMSFDNEMKLKVFLYRTTHNKCIDILRKNAVHSQNSEKLAEYNRDMLSEHAYVSEDIYREMFKAINRLPGKQRSVITMNLEGHNLKEIAEMLDITYETARTHKKRAIATLKTMLDKESILLLIAIIM